MADQAVSIPIVDLSALSTNGNHEQGKEAAHRLFEACRDFGFVLVVGLGIDASLFQEAFDWSKKLYDLPLEDKMKAPHPDGYKHHRGYSPPGLEKVYSKQELQSEDAIQTNGESLRKVSDFKESYEIGSEHNPAQQNIWLPEEILPGFRAFMTRFYWELHKSACLILEALSVGLQLTNAEKAYLFELHSGTNNQLRLLHYPQIPAEQLKSQVVARMPAHCDWSSFTMLFQDDCGGLEFEDPNQPGLFLPAKPIPGAVALNVGDMLQRFSNDTFPSATHRVTLPPLGSSMTKARYSIPYFVAPDNEKTVSSFSSCISPEHPAKFEPVSFAEYGANIAKFQYKRHGITQP